MTASEPEAVAQSVAPLTGGDGAYGLYGRSGRLERDDELLTLADAALGDSHGESGALLVIKMADGDG